MPKHRHHDREQYPVSRAAYISPALALIAIFLGLGLWHVNADAVLILIGVLAGTGFYLGRKARRRIARHHNAIRGDEFATVGFFLNLILLVPVLPILGAMRFMMD